MGRGSLLGGVLAGLLAMPAVAGPPEVTRAEREVHEHLLTLDTHLDTPASLDLPAGPSRICTTSMPTIPRLTCRA